MVRKFQNARQARTGRNMVNPAAHTCPLFDSSSFVPVPTLPRKLAIILLLAFLLFELVAVLSQCLCSESNKKNGEVSEYPQQAKTFLTNKIFLLQVMYRYVCVIFIVKCETVTLFSLLVQRFNGKA
jgi:hypothetical protein